MALLGIDEVGRGPWAGPLVIGAVILADPTADWCAELTDSKKLSAKKRTKLAEIILEKATATGLGWVSSRELDKIGLAKALKLATWRAVEAVEKSVENSDITIDNILIDGTQNFLAGTKYERITSIKPKADLLIKSVSAASIIAKVARDNYMKKLALKYPEYGFEKHVGYGTKTHREALEQYGLCLEHRRSFRPVARMLQQESEQEISSSVTRGESLRDSPVALRLYSSEISCSDSCPRSYPKAEISRSGFQAEELVAEYLQEQGHRIVARNHKTKFYEIDIISVYNDNIFFTEVKYRKTNNRGEPLEFIDKNKQTQMKFAAESFLKFQPQLAAKYSPLLAVASVSGPDFTIDDWFTLDS